MKEPVEATCVEYFKPEGNATVWTAIQNSEKGGAVFDCYRPK